LVWFRDCDGSSEPVQSKPKAGPFGPLGTTNAAFLKYFDRRKSTSTTPMMTSQSSTAGGVSPPVYRRICEPDPDEKITSI
jgi:hypothetical protein